MSKALVVANWKMNPGSFREAKRLLEATRKSAERAKGVSLVVAPPTIYLRDLHAGYKGRLIRFSAQDISEAPGGAHTGATSLYQAKEAGVSYVLVGHSERRAGGETNEDTKKKVAAALFAKVTPILCVGETTRGASGGHFEYVRDQLRAAFSDVPPSKVGKIVVAYEPVWAIGGEEAMKPREMHEMAIFIRKTLVGSHGHDAASPAIIYGGAATEVNAGTMLREGDVSGLLVGHVSVDSERFDTLLRSIS